jgi:hypothetical protein
MKHLKKKRMKRRNFITPKLFCCSLWRCALICLSLSIRVGSPAPWSHLNQDAWQLASGGHFLLVLGPSTWDEQQNKRLFDRLKWLDWIWTSTSHNQMECWIFGSCCIFFGQSNRVIWPWNIVGHWCDTACRGWSFFCLFFLVDTDLEMNYTRSKCSAEMATLE